MKYANEILLIYTFLATAVTLAVSQKPIDGMQVPNDQNAFITPKPNFERKNSNETDSNLRDLVSMAAQIAEFTDRSYKHRDDISTKNLKEQKVKYVQPFFLTNDKNNSSSSSTGKLNAEDEPQKISHKKKELSEQENQFKKAEEAENDSLETSPSEHVRTTERNRKREHNSPPKNVQNIKTRKVSDVKHQALVSSNETKEETRLLGIWKLPPEFIGFQISDGESANVVKPAAIVESRSFITNPEISSVQLNFVIPQGKVAQESNEKSSIVKNKQRRQHNNDESYSSAEHSGERPPSDVYTETDEDLRKFLDDDYKARIEQEAEASIKKNKQENNGGKDSSEDDKQPPHSHKHHKTAYSNNHSPSSPFPQSNNIYHGNSIPSKPYSQQEYVHHDRNKSPEIHSQRENVYNEANKSPQTFSKQKIAFPGGTVFFYKGMDGMLYDPALFPGLFESTKTRNSPNINDGYNQNSPNINDGYNQNSPNINDGYNQNSPNINDGYNQNSHINHGYNQNSTPSSEVYLSPDYERYPLYLEDGYPIEHSNVAHPPSSNFEQQPKLLLVQPIIETQGINEKRPRNLRPFSGPGNHQYAQPHSGKNLRQPPPVYKKHYREALKGSDEQYQEQPPTNYDHRERDLPVRDEYRKFQTNGNGRHSTIPYQQRQPNFREQRPPQFNSDSSEEDCSPEEKGLDQTLDLDEDYLPVAPVPQAKLNINNPIPVNVPQRPHVNDNLHPFNGNPERQNRYLSQEPITEQKNINTPIITSDHPYSPQGPDSEEYINPPIITSGHPYSSQGPNSEEEYINPPVISSNHPAYSHEQHAEPVEPYIEEKENPETFQYERKHKYQVSMYEHDESIYQSKAPKAVPYKPELKTNSEEFVPGHPLHSVEEPNIIPPDQNPNLISPQDKTRHIQFESGFRPMSSPAVYGPKPDCHRTIDSDISHSDPHINSMPSPHHQGVEHSGARKSPPAETYQNSPQDETNLKDMEAQNQNGKYFDTEGSEDEDFHQHTSPQGNHNPQQQYQDKSSEMPRSTEQTSRSPSPYSNSNEDKEPQHRHQPKLRVVTAPIPNLQQNKYPNADQYGDEHFEKDLSQRPEISSRYHESSEPQNEVSIEKKKSKKRSSKNSKGRRNKRNGKKANKNVKKSRKHRSTRENMMAEAATYHWGMENHKDKDGFFLYANVPQDDAYEYGYRMGGPEQLVEKHHRTEGDRTRIKLNWEDKNGDSGDQYWEFNHSSSEGEDEKPKKRTQKNTKS